MTFVKFKTDFWIVAKQKSGSFQVAEGVFLALSSDSKATKEIFYPDLLKKDQLWGRIWTWKVSVRKKKNSVKF